MPKRKVERFPLTLHHSTGQWSKCFTLPSGRRKTVYFGTESDAALEKYLKEKEDWQAGRNPREVATTAATAVTLADLVNAFLSRSKGRVALGEISPVTFADHLWVGQRMVEHLGRNRDPSKLTPDDFAKFRTSIATKYAPARLNKTITASRMIFKWGHESELIHLPRFGPDFKIAGKRLARSHKAATGAKLLTAEEIKALLKHADAQMTAIVLLGLNAGLGNADIAGLPISSLDLVSGVLDFPRPKSGVARRSPLWPETVAALQRLLPMRRPRPETEHLVFVNSRGSALLTVMPAGHRVDQVTTAFRKLATEAGIYRPRMGFYWLRHCTQTIGDEARDPLATAHIMGHSDGTIGGHYREQISDERLQRVTDHLRTWLFGGEMRTAKRKPRAK